MHWNLQILGLTETCIFLRASKIVRPLQSLNSCNLQVIKFSYSCLQMEINFLILILFKNNSLLLNVQYYFSLRTLFVDHFVCRFYLSVVDWASRVLFEIYAAVVWKQSQTHSVRGETSRQTQWRLVLREAINVGFLEEAMNNPERISRPLFSKTAMTDKRNKVWLCIYIFEIVSLYYVHFWILILL
jgi:hypothetical protein